MAKPRLTVFDKPPADAVSESDTSMSSSIPVTLSWRSYAAAISIALIVYIMILLWPLFQLVILAGLLSITLNGGVLYLQQRGWKRSYAQSVVLTTFVLGLGAFFYLFFPALFDQMGMLGQKYPLIRERILKNLPEGSAFRGYIEHYADASARTGLSKWYEQINWAGGKVLQTFWDFGMLLVIALYLVVDGPRLYQWFLAFFPEKTQDKIERTSIEGSDLIFAYMVGQLITSGITAVVSFAILKFSGVPAAGVLALSAGIFDIFPVVGFFISAIPAVLLALTVSPATGVAIGVAYLIYNIIENYYIIPKVYGKRLRLCTTTVILSLLIGWELAGVPGAVLALPVAASYAVIEAIWLSRFLHKRVVEEHQEQKAQEFGEQESTF